MQRSVAPPRRIPWRTLQAYLETEYRVDVTPPLVLRIGRHSPRLQTFLSASRATAAAYLTACNPRSHALPPWINRRRQARLLRLLRARGFNPLPGAGAHPRNAWRPEPSVLVPGLSCAAARALGRRFEQNAIVWCGAGAVPRLVRLR